MVAAVPLAEAKAYGGERKSPNVQIAGKAEMAEMAERRERRKRRFDELSTPYWRGLCFVAL